VKRLLVSVAGVLTVAAFAATGVTAQSAGSAAQAATNDAETTQQLQSRIEGLDAQVQVMQSDLDKLKKIKVSGYIQARYELNETSDHPTLSSNAPASGYTVKNPNLNRFFIRRGRLKVTYDSSPLSQAVIYFDGNTSGSDRNIRLLEAYVTLRDPWTPDHRHALYFGQMNIPFGYEIERSSSVRELPERSKAENTLFPGERDRGVTITNQWIPQLQTVVGLFNGPGINSTDYPTSPARKQKDIVARARWSQGIFDVAGSAYVGKNDVLLDIGRFTHDKTRYGADAQYYYEVPGVKGIPMGGGSVKFEVYKGKDYNSAAVDATTRALKPGKTVGDLSADYVGWYGMVVQNIGDAFQFAARYDFWDPNTSKTIDATQHDQYKRVGLGLNYFFDANIRLTAAYDMPTTESKVGSAYRDPRDNFWTLQIQHKF
jgi:hypothetical protein